jgi:hypothetical protein
LVPVCVFEIYISTISKPCTALDLPKDWSFYPKEEEVLLMPFFCFQVVSIKKRTEGPFPITLITLLEIPYQNFLNMRKITLNSLIWADSNMSSAENQ